MGWNETKHILWPLYVYLSYFSHSIGLLTLSVLFVDWNLVTSRFQVIGPDHPELLLENLDTMIQSLS